MIVKLYLHLVGNCFFLWPLLFTKTELIGRMVFWLGYPLATTGLYLLLRALNVNRNASMIGSLIFAATPIVMRYAVGLKPGLWLAVFLLGTAFWMVQTCRNPEQVNRHLFLAGLFSMLSINIKFTALGILLPVLFLPLFLGRNHGKLLAIGSVVLGIIVGYLTSGLAIVVSFNLVNYGHILGPEAMRQVHASDLTLIQIYTHAVRLPLLLFEFPEIPFSAVRNALTTFGNNVIYFLGASELLPLENKETWPGFYVYTMPKYANKFSLGGLIWLPLLAVGLAGVIKDTLNYLSKN